MLGLTRDNSDFIKFLWLSKGEQIMQENSMSIQLESENFFYDNFNTQECFYDFLLNQQDENKLIIKKKYHITKLSKIIYTIFYKVLTMNKLISSIFFSDKNVKCVVRSDSST